MTAQKLKLESKKLFFVLNILVGCTSLLQGASSDPRRGLLFRSDDIVAAGRPLTDGALMGASSLSEQPALTNFFSKHPFLRDTLCVAGAVTLVSTGIYGAYRWNSWRQQMKKGKTQYPVVLYFGFQGAAHPMTVGSDCFPLLLEDKSTTALEEAQGPLLIEYKPQRPAVSADPVLQVQPCGSTPLLPTVSNQGGTPLSSMGYLQRLIDSSLERRRKAEREGIQRELESERQRETERKRLRIEHFKSDLAQGLVPSHAWDWDVHKYWTSDVQPYCSGYERPLPPHINAIARVAARYMQLPPEHYPFMYLTSRSRAHASSIEFNKIGIPDKESLEELYIPGNPQLFFTGNYLADVLTVTRSQKLYHFFMTLFHELAHIKHQHAVKNEDLDMIDELGQEMEADLWSVGMVYFTMTPTILDDKIEEDDQHPTDDETRKYRSLLLLKLSDSPRAKALREKFSTNVGLADESMLTELNSLLHKEVSDLVWDYKFNKRYYRPVFLSSPFVGSASSSTGPLSTIEPVERGFRFEKCPLYLATEDADIEKMDQLLAGGDAGLGLRNPSGNPFHAALGDFCKNPSKIKAMIDKLIAAKLDVNVKDVVHETPLHLIAKNKKISADNARYVIQRLLEAGAKWKEVNMFGRTPIEAAIYYGLPDRAEAIRRFVEELSLE